MLDALAWIHGRRFVGMNTEPCVREDLAALDRVRGAMWIVDPGGSLRWWANRAALRLWNAGSLAEWAERNVSQPPSEATRTRLQSMLRRLAHGEAPVERWTLYPDGAQPVAAECTLSAVHICEQRGDAGRLAMLVEARPLAAGEGDPIERRSYEALRHLSERVSVYGASGEALLRNPAAIRDFGDPAAPGQAVDQFAASFVAAEQAAEARAEVEHDRVFRADLPARTLTGETWFDTEVRRTLDPVTGGAALLVTQRDISERRAHVEALERSREQQAAQAAVLRSLAAPVIRVGDGVLALPLIGALDRERMQVALTALLEHTARGRVRRVVLDLTGAAVDAAAADELLAIVRVLRLQGVASALSGIGPQLARAIVTAGLEIGAVPCFRSVEEALADVGRERGVAADGS